MEPQTDVLPEGQARKTAQLCFLCNEDSKLFKKVKAFDHKKLTLCNKKLEIRKDKGWKFADIKLPTDIEGIFGYHAECYAKFIKVSGKVIKNTAESRKSRDRTIGRKPLPFSAKEKDNHAPVARTSQEEEYLWERSSVQVPLYVHLSVPESFVADIFGQLRVYKSVPAPFNADTRNYNKHSDYGEGNDESRNGPEDTENLGGIDENNISAEPNEGGDGASQQESTITPDFVENALCFFCDKERRKRKGRYHNVTQTSDYTTFHTVQRYAIETNDDELLTKLREATTENKRIPYHHICKIDYVSKCKTAMEDKSTLWHVKRNNHALAYEKLCDFIQVRVIDERRAVDLKFLGNLFINFLREQYATIKTINPEIFTSRHIPSKIKKTFRGSIKIISLNTEKIVVHHEADTRSMQYVQCEDENTIRSAAILLRSHLRNGGKKTA